MAGDKARIEVYFKQVVRDYNCGDVRALLNAELEQAGPLLTSVVNGMDLVGGMAHGFSHGSADRSVQFMKKYLAVSEEEAKLLYALVRCGMDHEGTTKLAVRFFVHYECRNKGVFLYKDRESCIWLNVTELAYAYLQAIDRIATDVHAHLSHIPELSKKDENVFVAALEKIGADIGDFCKVAWYARDAVEQARQERGDIKARSSANPFLTEYLKGFTTPKV
jgi:hypothetical protein